MEHPRQEGQYMETGEEKRSTRYLSQPMGPLLVLPLMAVLAQPTVAADSWWALAASIGGLRNHDIWSSMELSDSRAGRGCSRRGMQKPSPAPPPVPPHRLHPEAQRQELLLFRNGSRVELPAAVRRSWSQLTWWNGFGVETGSHHVLFCRERLPVEGRGGSGEQALVKA